MSEGRWFGKHKREKKEKRKFQKFERFPHYDWTGIFAKHKRVYPDPSALPYYHFEVRVTRTQKQMRLEIRRLEGKSAFKKMDRNVAGACFNCGISKGFWGNRVRNYPAGRIGRIYLNREDLRMRPGEIPSHEATHAALAWGRWRKADLKTKEGEEIVCHAQGRILQQLANIIYA